MSIHCRIIIPPACQGHFIEKNMCCIIEFSRDNKTEIMLQLQERGRESKPLSIEYKFKASELDHKQ